MVRIITGKQPMVHFKKIDAAILEEWLVHDDLSIEQHIEEARKKAGAPPEAVVQELSPAFPSDIGVLTYRFVWYEVEL